MLKCNGFVLKDDGESLKGNEEPIIIDGDEEVLNGRRLAGFFRRKPAKFRSAGTKANFYWGPHLAQLKIAAIPSSHHIPTKRCLIKKKICSVFFDFTDAYLTVSISAKSKGGGPRVVVSTAAFHARVRGSVPGLGGVKETKIVSSPSTCES